MVQQSWEQWWCRRWAGSAGGDGGTGYCGGSNGRGDGGGVRETVIIMVWPW